jgi:hypothetical protein
MTKRARKNAGFCRGLPLKVSDVWAITRAVRAGTKIPPGTKKLILDDLFENFKTADLPLSNAITRCLIAMQAKEIELAEEQDKLRNGYPTAV